LSIDEFGVPFIASCGKMRTAAGLLRLLLLHQLDYICICGHCVNRPEFGAGKCARRRCETNRLFTALKGVEIKFYEGICRIFELKQAFVRESRKNYQKTGFPGLERPCGFANTITVAYMPFSAQNQGLPDIHHLFA
jgi:hypothetical protein